MRRLLVIASLLAFASVPNASAGVMTFELGDHSGGNSTAYSYGLRLDGSNLYLSLSSANGASMFADWDDGAGTFRIYGTAVQSFSDGTFGAEHTIEYTIGDEGRLPDNGSSGEGSKWVAAGAGGASWKGEVGDGLEVRLASDSSLVAALDAKRDSTGFAMDFYEDGYRLTNDSSTWVGRGWLMDNGTNDFLFTATQTIDESPGTVPEPGSLAIFGVGALTMLGFRRRKKNNKSS